jgi:O-antigen/teichoic acid export membrane protein
MRYAMMSSLGSKVVSVALQLLALPVAIHALGHEQFALYSMLAAAAGWVALTHIGIGPGLVVTLASASVDGDESTETGIFTSAFLPVLVLSLVAALAYAIGSPFLLTPTVFGEQYQAYAGTIRTGVAILVGLTLLRTVLSVVESSQAGYQELHLVNLRGAVGNLISLVVLLLLPRLGPTLINMILAVNLPLLFAQLVNAISFFRRRPYLAPKFSRFDRRICKALVGQGVAFSLAGTLGNYLNHQFIVIQVGRLLDAYSTAAFAASISAFLLAFGMVTMISMPLWPAIADGLRRGERRWISNVYRKVLLTAMLYALTVSLVFAVAGPELLRLWLRGTIVPSTSLMVAVGVYFVLDTWEYVHYMVLIGMGKIATPSFLYVARSLLVVVAAPVLIGRYGEVGAVIALCISVVLFTGATFPYLVYRGIHRVDPVSDRTASTELQPGLAPSSTAVAARSGHDKAVI